MTLFWHEIKRNRLSLFIWSGAISLLLAICVLIYPEMSKQMADMEDMLSQMGGFSDAFGMNDVNIGEFMGYFAIECSETLGLGGAIFASILGAGILSKEERGRTADLLLSHPISRVRVVAEKLLAVVAQVAFLNIAIILLTSLSIFAIGETVDIKIMALIFLSYFILQTEIAIISFCISAFVGKGSTGIGIGVAVFFYFVNLISNLTDDLDFLKYVTPFGYAEGTSILSNEAIEIKYLAIGLAVVALAIFAAFANYRRKDIK